MQHHKCARCGISCYYGQLEWTETDAMAEHYNNFPQLHGKYVETVQYCDNCYEWLLAWCEKNPDLVKKALDDCPLDGA